ncbi:phage integrase family protein, partial [Enterobacter hormaechei]
PATLQAYMGHRDFKSTQHYLRVFALDVGIGRNRGIQFTFPPDPAMLSMLTP